MSFKALSDYSDIGFTVEIWFRTDVGINQKAVLVKIMR